MKKYILTDLNTLNVKHYKVKIGTRNERVKNSSENRKKQKKLQNNLIIIIKERLNEKIY